MISYFKFKNIKYRFNLNSKLINLDTLLFVSFVVFIITTLLQLYLSNKYAVKSMELSNTISQTKEVKKQISIAKSQLYSMSSVSNIEQKAVLLGFNQNASPAKKIPELTFAASIDLK